jgi:4a-hydroxytetrahydrobiopterin dehydratase
MTDFTTHHCEPCEGGTAPLTKQQAQDYLSSVVSWELKSGEVLQLERVLVLGSFMEVIELVNKIAKLAESEGHHPDLRIFDYKKLSISLTTHAIKGLSMNDFIMAAKINELVSGK